MTLKTSYQEVYDIFVNRIEDHPFLTLPEEDVEEFCFKYFRMALAKFRKCKKDLTDRNDALGQFNFKLDDDEIDIVVTLMLVEWLTPQVFNITMTKQFLSDKEYDRYSQANHLKELHTLRKDTIDEADGLISAYNWDSDEIGDLK